MAKSSSDIGFETRFYEAILKRDPRFIDVVEILGGLYWLAHYNLACSLALSRRPSAALRSLKRAVRLGYSDYDWMQQDPDLDGLKKHPTFRKLLTKLQPQS